MREGTSSSKPKRTTAKRRKPAKRKLAPQALGGRIIYWVFGAVVLAIIMLAWALWPTGSDTYYIDGVSVRLSEQDVNLRDVVWETPTLVFEDTGEKVNMYDPAVSADGQLMIFVKGRPRKGADLYMARRKGEGWGDPEPLASINTDYRELGPALSRDGNKLFFYSDRRDETSSGRTDTDIWLSQRDAGGNWGEPRNLGPAVNSIYDEKDPAVFSINMGDAQTPEWQVERLYFASKRPRGDAPASPEDSWIDTGRADDSDLDLFSVDTQAVEGGAPGEFEFVDAQRLVELNTEGKDCQPSITRRGDFLYFASDGRGSSSGFDLFRSRIFQGVFQPVEKLGNSVNTDANETDPTLLSDGHHLIFSSDQNPDDLQYRLYKTISREVFPHAEIHTDTHSSWTFSFFDLLDKYKWWLALLLLSLLGLLLLLKNFINESRRAQLTLMQRCLMGSLAMHMLLAFLLSLWLVSEAIYKHIKEEMVEITLNSGALAAQEEEQALRKPVEAQLTRASATLPEPQQVNPRVAQQQAQPATAQSALMKAAKVPTASAVVAKSQTADVESQAAQLSTAPAAIPLELTATAQVNSVTLEEAQSATDAPQALAQVSSNVKVNLAPQFTDVYKSALVAVNRGPEAAEVAEDFSAARKNSAVVAKDTKTNLETAQASSDLIKVSTDEALTARLETGKINATDEQALAKASNQQSIKQAAEAVTKKASAEPAVRTAGQIAAAKVTSRIGVTKSPAASTVATVETLKTAQAVNPAAITETMAIAELKLEATESIAEIGPNEAKVASRQAIKPATYQEVAKIDPLASQTVPPQIQHSATSLMTTNTPQARLPAVSQLPFITKLTSPLPKDVEAAQLAIQFETQPGGVEMAQSLAKAVDNAKAIPQPAAEAAAETGPADNTPSAVATNRPVAGTAVERQTVATAGVPSRLLPSTSVAPFLAGPTLPELLEVETETTRPIISSATHFDIATRGQAVQPADQSSSLAPQIIEQPISSLTFANLPVGQVPPRQMVVVGPGAPGRSLSRFQPGKKEVVEALQLSGVNMEASGGGRGSVMEGDAFQVATSRGASVTINPDTTRAGQPLPVMQRADEPPVKIEVVKMIEQSSTPDVDISPRPLGDIDDPSATLKLADIDIPEVPSLEAPRQFINPFVLRNNPKKRMEIIDRLGGSEETERAIIRALDWFTENQEEDGHWDGPSEHDHAATGMAMLAYMGWGAKHTEKGRYRKPLKKAVDWMVKHTGPDGDLRGSRRHQFMYDHGIAAIAMTEAYSLTKDPSLRPVVERIVGFTVRAQDPKAGGWRYWPYREKRESGDMSVAGWQIMALKSAQLGGIDVPPKSLDKAIQFMKSIYNPKRAYGYQNKNYKSPAMVAEGMFCLQLLRQHEIDNGLATSKEIDKRLNTAVKQLAKNFPNPRHVKYNYYYWYYAFLALHQHQGPVWERWNKLMRPILLKAQVDSPGRTDLHGSFDAPGDPWSSGQDHRCIVTAMAALSLEVYYRYLPINTPTWAQDAKKGK